MLALRQSSGTTPSSIERLKTMESGQHRMPAVSFINLADITSGAILLHEVLTERVRSSDCFLHTSHKHDTCLLPSEWYINFCVPPMVSRPHCTESTSNSAFNDIYYASVPCSGSYRKSMLSVLHQVASWKTGWNWVKTTVLASGTYCVRGKKHADDSRTF